MTFQQKEGGSFSGDFPIYFSEGFAGVRLQRLFSGDLTARASALKKVARNINVPKTYSNSSDEVGYWI